MHGCFVSKSFKCCEVGIVSIGGSTSFFKLSNIPLVLVYVTISFSLMCLYDLRDASYSQDVKSPLSREAINYPLINNDHLAEVSHFNHHVLCSVTKLT